MEDLYKKQIDVIKKINALVLKYKKDPLDIRNLEYLEQKLEYSKKYLQLAEDINIQLCEDYELEFPKHKYFANAEFTQIKTNLENLMESITTEIQKIHQVKDEDVNNIPDNDNNEVNNEVKEYNTKIQNYRNKFTNFITNHCDDSYANIQDALIMELTKFFTKLDEKHDEFYDSMKIKSVIIERQHQKLRVIFYEKLGKIQESKIQNNSNCKLPNVKIPTFDGNYLSWLSFRDHFLKFVHIRTDMDAIQKMNYLIAFTSGEPQNLLKNIPIGEENYEKAWSILNNRYHNKRLLINAVFDKIINYTTVSSNSDDGIKNMHDMLQSALHSTTCLSNDQEAFSALLIHLMSQKMDNESRELFENSLDDTHEVPTQEEFLTFLEKRFKALEASSQNSSTQNYQNGNKTHFKKESHKPVNSTSSHQNNCKICNETHKIRSCPAFINMNVDQRQQTVNEMNVCGNCLAPNHTINNCRSNWSCAKCNEWHHTLLHKDNATNQGATNQNASNQKSSNQNISNQKSSNQNSGGNRHNNQNNPQQNNQRSSNNTHPQNSQNYNCYLVDENSDYENKKNPLLATAVIRSTKNGYDEYLRAIIDPASHASFITEETVQRLNLIKRKAVPVDVSCLGISKPGDIQCMVTLNIKPRFDSNFSMNIEALVMQTITKPLPSEYIEHRNWNHIQNIRLADPDFHTPAPIDILLGANHYNEIMLNGIKKGTKFTPLAQQTEFGWILTGMTTSEVNQNESVTLVTTQEVDNNLKKFFEKEEITDQLKQNITCCITTAQIAKNKSNIPKINIVWIFTLFVLFMIIIGGYATEPYKVTQFVNHPGLHFEDMGRLRLINSDWNIVVYYKLDNYLKELKHLNNHLQKLEGLCGLYKHSIHQKEICYGIVTQFKHQVKEKVMKNELLTDRASEIHFRRRRGLANFVGSLANQFFGILDENFAIQYKKDIEKLAANENYLLKLIKNQTTIAESTINIFKESSESIEKKFKIVDAQLEYFRELFSHKKGQDLQQQMNISDTFSLLSTQLTLAFMNYQNQQNAIIEVILASHSGKIHPLLLTPTQLKQQINLIRHEIPTTLMIPGNETPEGLVQLYKIMSSMARIVDDYVIIDIKLPLPEREEFQIFNLIPVPTPYMDKYIYIEPSSKFLVTNLQRTLIYQMDDIDHCTTISEYYFCRQNHPMYNRDANISRCEIELLNHARQISSACNVKTREPEVVWIQLRFSNQWIFVMDHQYTINMICNNTVSILELSGDGILHLEPGCSIKHNSIIITSQDLFKSHLSASFSPVTNLSQQLDTWIHHQKTMPTSNFTLFDPSMKIQQIKKDIESLKEATEDDFNWEKLHHFTVPYISIILMIIVGICIFLYRRRAQRIKKRNTNMDPIDIEMTSLNDMHIESL